MELAKKAIEFIKEYREYLGLVELAQLTHPLHRDEITDYPPEFKISLPCIGESEFEKKPLEDVPDSDEYVLIDIGSKLGTRVTLPFAKARPKVQVYMVDDLTREKIIEVMTHNMLDHGPYEITNPIIEDEETVVNNLLQKNGYHNARYIQKHLRFNGPLELGIEDEIESKRVVVTGFRNPAGLGNLTVMEAARLGAERVYLNNSALEGLKPDSKLFDWMREYLSEHTSSEEIEKIAGLFKDGLVISRYNCGNKDKFAIALKLLFVLAQKAELEKAGYEVGIFLNVKERKDNHFNQPDCNVIGQKV